MSETSEPITDEQENLAPLSHRRILLIMGLIVLAGSILIFIFVSWRFGLGFLIGGILAFVNYYWLKISLKNVFEKVVGRQSEIFRDQVFFAVSCFGIDLDGYLFNQNDPVYRGNFRTFEFCVCDFNRRFD